MGSFGSVQVQGALDDSNKSAYLFTAAAGQPRLFCKTEWSTKRG